MRRWTVPVAVFVVAGEMVAKMPEAGCDDCVQSRSTYEQPMDVPNHHVPHIEFETNMPAMSFVMASGSSSTSTGRASESLFRPVRIL